VRRQSGRSVGPLLASAPVRSIAYMSRFRTRMRRPSTGPCSEGARGPRSARSVGDGVADLEADPLRRHPREEEPPIDLLGRSVHVVVAESLVRPARSKGSSSFAGSIGKPDLPEEARASAAPASSGTLTRAPPAARAVGAPGGNTPHASVMLKKAGGESRPSEVARAASRWARGAASARRSRGIKLTASEANVFDLLFSGAPRQGEHALDVSQFPPAARTEGSRAERGAGSDSSPPRGA